MQEVTQWIGKKNELSPRESVRLLQVHERCNGSAVKIQEAFQTCKLHVLQQPEWSSTLYPYQYHPKKILIQKRKNRIPGGNRPPGIHSFKPVQKGSIISSVEQPRASSDGQLVEETVRRKRSTGIPIFNTGTSLQGIRANVKKGGIKVGVGFGDVQKLHRAKGGAAQKSNITGGNYLLHRGVETRRCMR